MGGGQRICEATMIPLRINRRWLGCSCIVLLLMGAGLYSWHGIMVERLRRAAGAGDFGRCVKAGGYLPYLVYWAGDEARLLNRCRRRLALEGWDKGNHQEALDLQEQVVRSPQAIAKDHLLLSTWVDQRRQEARDHYRKGDLASAVAVLQQLSIGQDPLRDDLISHLQVRWNRNRDLYAKAVALSAEERWWESLNAINWLDHPWWRARSQPLRSTVIAATQQAGEPEGNDADHHNGLSHTVPVDELDERVRHHLIRGLDGWNAYVQACQELGGVVIQRGPESACRR